MARSGYLASARRREQRTNDGRGGGGGLSFPRPLSGFKTQRPGHAITGDLGAGGKSVQRLCLWSVLKRGFSLCYPYQTRRGPSHSWHTNSADLLLDCSAVSQVSQSTGPASSLVAGFMLLVRLLAAETVCCPSLDFSPALSLRPLFCAFWREGLFVFI